jgi:hypothetical protein
MLEEEDGTLILLNNRGFLWGRKSDAMQRLRDWAFNDAGARTRSSWSPNIGVVMKSSFAILAAASVPLLLSSPRASAYQVRFNVPVTDRAQQAPRAAQPRRVRARCRDSGSRGTRSGCGTIESLGSRAALRPPTVAPSGAAFAEALMKGCGIADRANTALSALRL